MNEGRRSWAFRWWIPLLSALFAALWPTVRPEGSNWLTWTPLLAVAAAVWLAWASKCWLLGLLTGLVVVHHPHLDWSAWRSPTGWQLVSLLLTACWCQHFYELLWSPGTGRRTWVFWTLVGVLVMLPGTWRPQHPDAEPAAPVAPALLMQTFAILLLLWVASGLAVLWWWQRHRHRPGAWKRWSALLVPLVLSAVWILAWKVSGRTPALARHPQPTPSALVGAETFSLLTALWRCWRQAMYQTLPVPDWLLGIWPVTLVVVWGLWRSIRRAWRCVKQDVAPSSLVLALIYLAAFLRAALPSDQTPANAAALTLPMTVLILGYWLLDLGHGVVEKMQLPPPQNKATNASHSA